MADGGFGRCESKEYTAAYLMSIDNLDATMLMADRVESEKFTCLDDPKEVEFRVELLFEEDEVFLRPETKVFLREFTLTTYDEDMKRLNSWKYPHRSIHIELAEIWDFKISKIRNSSSSIRIIFKIVYNNCCRRISGPCSSGWGTCTAITPELANVIYRNIPDLDPKLPKDMLAILDSGKRADFTFIVGKEKIKAHKAILTARSNHFANMFDSGMRECAENEVEIHDAEPLEFKEFLKFLYSGSSPKNLPEIATSLMPLADRYGAIELKDMCVEAIRCSLSNENVVDVLLLADLHDSPDLMKFGISWFKANVRKLKKSSAWTLLSQNPEIMLKILESLG